MCEAGCGFKGMICMLTQKIPNEHLFIFYKMILNHLDDIFYQSMNAKQVLSLVKANLGVIELESLAIYVIEEGLSLICGLHGKHATKKIGRLLNILWQARDSDGLECIMKANVSMSHGYSFFRQGVIYYQPLTKMKEHEIFLLINNFVCYLRQHRSYISMPKVILDLKMRG